MKKIFSTLFLLSVTILAFGQPGMGEDPNEGIPINGGILYLMISGLTYGIYHIKRKISAKR